MTDQWVVYKDRETIPDTTLIDEGKISKNGGCKGTEDGPQCSSVIHAAFHLPGAGNDVTPKLISFL